MKLNLEKIYKKYPKNGDCIKQLEAIIWNKIPRCPYCRAINVTKLKIEPRYHCNTCNTSFSVTVGTIFHKTKIDLQKWFLAILLILKAEKSISTRTLAKGLRVNKNTGWYLLKRIREAMLKDTALLKGIVEAIGT